LIHFYKRKPKVKLNKLAKKKELRETRPVISDQQPQPLPTGRARGRARGAPRTAEEARAAVRKPGEVPGPRP